MRAEALAVIDKTEEQFHRAELYRLKGELTLQKFKVQAYRSAQICGHFWELVAAKRIFRNFGVKMAQVSGQVARTYREFSVSLPCSGFVLAKPPYMVLSNPQNHKEI